MTDNKAFVLDTMRKFGESAARDLQSRAPEMTGTEIYAEAGFLPAFNAAKQYLNYAAGYVCRSAAGRAVKLLQPYDSTIYTQQPEELPAPGIEDLGLWERVEALPEKQRTVIHLHYAEGYSVEEIAGLLGTTASAVKMRLKRGRDALRSTWEEHL